MEKHCLKEVDLSNKLRKLTNQNLEDSDLSTLRLSVLHFKKIFFADLKIFAIETKTLF